MSINENELFNQIDLFSLFPMMPRHNLYKIQPEVKEICEKYKIPYITKPIGRAFGDILT